MGLLLSPLGAEEDEYQAGEPAIERASVEPGAPDDRAAFVSRHVEPARDRTRTRMLAEVDEAWRRPEAASGDQTRNLPLTAPSPLWQKLNGIVVPEVIFNDMELDRAVQVLGTISVEYDRTGQAPTGINFVLLDRSGASPAVNLILRGLTLKRVLDFVTDAAGYQYEVQQDAVIIRPGGESPVLETRFFPVSRSTALRMTGRFGPMGNPAPANGSGVEGDGALIRNFLQMAGVNFNDVPGSTLAFDGSQLIVTQSARNLERIHNILARYRVVRQVEIEAKFMEVQEGALEELGFQWQMSSRASSPDRGQSQYNTGSGVTRSLAEAFRNAASAQQITISNEGQPNGGLVIPSTAPLIPGGVMLANSAMPLATYTGVVGEFQVSAIMRALAQKSGTELLSAPKLTVLSGNPATITVAQELRYPQSYGQIQSQVGTGSLSGGGSAGVSVTSGTPQEFTTRNVGVELRVTPTVEEDDHSISLDLNPKVTEFEGFVEYGGPSIAISGGTTVTVPPGFYQPIFGVREVNTKVTIWDGATLIMGGLTREDVKKVHDKVPVLGSVPLIGRFFRSDGESAQKRNLLIFVTATLVNPGGVPQVRAAARNPVTRSEGRPANTPPSAAGREAD
jgi:general secretion pathway protein D